MPFDSKGFAAEGERKARELRTELLALSKEGRIPVLCDMSPCVYRMRSTFEAPLQVYEPGEFIHRFLLERLRLQRQRDPVALHVTCSSVKMGVGSALEAIARACAEEVVIPSDVGCCGFAGDRGFTYPELNASALSNLKSSLPPNCRTGYSNSRTCEIGLSLHSGIPYQSIVFLVDRCSQPMSG